MSKMINVKYRCLHPSCCVNCREGVFAIEEDYFTELSAGCVERCDTCVGCEEEVTFKSPRGICRLGMTQIFKVRSKSEAEVAGGVERNADSPDPMGLLKAEHRDILKKIGRIEDQLRTRDVEALWISTNEFENQIMLHSGIKEEDVLFSVVRQLPLGEALMAIMKEEHREIMSILHSFRMALDEGYIQNNIILSMIVSLKSHIRKEDYEFFDLVDDCLDDEKRKVLVEGMKNVEKTFIPKQPGQRGVITAEKKAAAEHRRMITEGMLALKEVSQDGGCSCA